MKRIRFTILQAPEPGEDAMWDLGVAVFDYLAISISLAWVL